MKNKIAVLLFLVVLLGGGVYWYYQNKVADYPFVLLENIIKSRLVSSTTYQRLDSKNSVDSSSATIYIKFASQNRAGAMVDSEALMVLVPIYEFERIVDPFRAIVAKEYYESKKNKEKQMVDFDYGSSSICELIIGNDTYTTEQLEILNTDLNLKQIKSSFPFDVPTPVFVEGGFNLFTVMKEASHKLFMLPVNFTKYKHFLLEWFNNGDGKKFYQMSCAMSDNEHSISVKLTSLENTPQEAAPMSDGRKKEILDKYICPNEQNSFWEEGKIAPNWVNGYLDNTDLGSCFWVRK